MNLESLKITLFWKIVDSNCIEFIDKKFYVNKKYSESELEEIDTQWKKLYDEFYTLRKNKSGQYQLDKNTELVKLSSKLELLSDIENRLTILCSMSSVPELENFVIERTILAIHDLKNLYTNVRVNTLNSPLETLSIVQSIIKSQINIYEEKLGVKDKTMQKQKETIYDVVSMMGKYLGYALDINNMSCMEFLGHENTINSMSKSEKANLK
jgi:hypothetical protein